MILLVIWQREHSLTWRCGLNKLGRLKKLMPNPQCRLLGSSPRHQALDRAGMVIFMLSLVASLHEGKKTRSRKVSNTEEDWVLLRKSKADLTEMILKAQFLQEGR